MKLTFKGAYICKIKVYSWWNSHFSIVQKDFKENKAGKEEGNITIFCTPTICQGTGDRGIIQQI